jgi:SanA protein
MRPPIAYTPIMKRLLIFLAYGCGIILILILIVNVFVHFEAGPYIYDSLARAPDAEVALIPGAAVLSNGALSPVLEDRANMAIQLYRAKKVLKILVSGDNSTVSYNEVNPVRNYLLTNGIPDQDIFLDHAGFDTYSTMYRARDIFGVTSILIASQSFHLSRAVFIARELGINAYGVNADAGHYLLINYIREVFADEKAVFDLIVHQKPEYLGAQIPIMGDGSASP